MMKLPTRQQCDELLDEYGVPENIRKHSLLVNKVALFLARMLEESGEKIDIELVDRASLLHDLDKVRTLKGGHGGYTCKVLEERGYPELARTVMMHTFSHLIKMDFRNWEEKILNYADKRSQGDKLVLLKQRLDDFKERYGDVSGKGDAGRSNCFRIEADIFGRIGIKPEDLGDILA